MSDQSGKKSHHHIVPFDVNFAVFAALLLLTVITVGVAQVDLGAANLPVAMLVASIKAAIVFLWFMHLKYEGLVNRVIFASSVFFLILFYAITAADVFFRV